MWNWWELHNPILMMRPKQLRTNLVEALNINTKEESDAFMSGLSHHDKEELLSYVSGIIIPFRYRSNTSIDKYFLIHYKDYITNDDRKIQSKANITLNLLILTGVAIVAIIYMLKH